MKRDKNLIERKDERLEDAVELDGWGLAVFENIKDGLVLSNIYLREDHSQDYRLKFIGSVCLSKLPEFLQKEFDSKQIMHHPDCYMGTKEKSCDKCVYNQSRIFSDQDYLK